MRRFIATAAVAGMALAAMLVGGPAAASPVSADGGASASAPATALEPDHLKCKKPFTHPRMKLRVQNCPDWAPNNSIPVHARPTPGSRIVGHIHAPGADWYRCQLPGETYQLGEFENIWWAHTMSDNNNWGYVNQVYFQGGKNFERDGGLRECPNERERPR